MDSPPPVPPTPVPLAQAPGPPAPSQRSAQVALAVFLAVLLGLLAFRGYGARLGARPTETAAVARVDLNTADRAELAQIPGVGPKLAEAIEEHRRNAGPFHSVEGLKDVKGIGDATFDKVRPYIRVDPRPADDPAPDPEPLVLERKKPAAPPAPAKPVAPPAPTGGVRKLQPGDPPVNINTASAEQLQQLPGVGPATARNIVAARPFRSVDDLDRVKGIGPKTLDKIRPFAVAE